MNGYEIVFVEHLISSSLYSRHNRVVTLFWVYFSFHDGLWLGLLVVFHVDKPIGGEQIHI